MNVRLVSTLLASGVFALSAHGQAFCRATTCDPSTGACERDDSSCLITGKPLFWASSCMQVYVQADGSPQDGIDFATAEQSVRRAFDAWLSTDCGSTSPLLDVQVLGPITCGTGEYNSTQHNANIVVFRDDQWPYPASEDTLGFTDLHFNADTGELWDADLEINSFNYRFSVGDPVTDNDLDSMLTHEAGHMLGLAHTLVKDATMFASYTPGTSSLRTLADDDVQAVCAAYAPDRVPSRTSCSPRHGFSDACGAQQPANSATDEGTDQETSSNGGDATSKGCAIANVPSTGARGTLWAALGVACGFALRRSRRHQFVSCEHPRRRR
jgi:Matrixin